MLEVKGIWCTAILHWCLPQAATTAFQQGWGLNIPSIPSILGEVESLTQSLRGYGKLCYEVCPFLIGNPFCWSDLVRSCVRKSRLGLSLFISQPCVCGSEVIVRAANTFARRSLKCHEEGQILNSFIFKRFGLIAVLIRRLVIKLGFAKGETSFFLLSF